MLERINTVYLSDNIVLQKVDNEKKYYALNIENGDCFEITHTAYFILDLLQTINDTEIITQEMVYCYGITHQQAKQDLKEMLDDCIKNAIVITRTSILT